MNYSLSVFLFTDLDYGLVINKSICVPKVGLSLVLPGLESLSRVFLRRF